MFLPHYWQEDGWQEYFFVFRRTGCLSSLFGCGAAALGSMSSCRAASLYLFAAAKALFCCVEAMGISCCAPVMHGVTDTPPNNARRFGHIPVHG